MYRYRYNLYKVEQAVPVLMYRYRYNLYKVEEDTDPLHMKKIVEQIKIVRGSG
jgi:hypothetical protein